MSSIKQEKFNKNIKENLDYNFEINERGLYSISITASCRSGKQIRERGGEDLKVEIDGHVFREIPQDKNTQLYNIPASWNGTKLKGLNKTIVFILWLEKGSHQINFIPKKGATLESLEIKELDKDIKSLSLDINKQAQDGDRRPWYALVLINLPLRQITAKAATKYRFLDSDDIKLIIDNKIKKPRGFFFKWKNWLWSGSIFKKLFKKETQTEIIKTGLSEDIHYVEFWADRMPTLHEVGLDFEKEIKVKRIPTVDDPKWTEDFKDDTEEIILARLIFGEANGQPYEAKRWVGWSVINRIEADSWWPKTIHEVILQDKQYDPFKKNDKTFPKIINPLGFGGGVDQKTRESWFDCYQIAEEIVSRKTNNPTKATHFHGIGITREWFEKNMVPKGKFLKQIGDSYFYWSPN